MEGRDVRMAEERRRRDRTSPTSYSALHTDCVCVCVCVCVYRAHMGGEEWGTRGLEGWSRPVLVYTRVHMPSHIIHEQTPRVVWGL